MSWFRRYALGCSFFCAGSFMPAHIALAEAAPPPPALASAQLAGLPPPLSSEQSLPLSALFPQLLDKSVIEREKIALELLEAGHFPSQLRQLKKVSVQSEKHELHFWVMPDYLALGNDAEAMLMPLSFVSARRLMEIWGFYLPTRKMVDLIYKEAALKIWPRTYPPSPAMNSMEFALDHSRWIEGQRYLFPEQNVLAAGHKKDVVLSSRLYQRSHRQAIYGWNNIRGGETIQPLSIWHGDQYVDYSHGLRLVAPWVLLDGKIFSLKELLADAELASLLSDEGPIDVDRLLRSAPRSIAHN